MVPKRVLIVGGGRAGWMAAAYLNAALEGNGQRPVDIGVVDSPDTPQDGAAEAATPTIRHILAVLGIDEIEFLRCVDGTFRQATRYVNWLRGSGDFYYHPFDDSRAQPLDRAALEWLMSDRSIAFAETTSPQPVICDLGLAPRPVEGQFASAPLKYAYHLDAAQGALLEHLAPGDDSAFGLTVLGEGKIDTAEVVATARSVAMFASRRVVLLRDVAALDGEAEPLVAYAKKPPSESYLLVRAPKLDLRRPLHKAIVAAGKVLQFARPEDPAGGAFRASEIPKNTIIPLRKSEL